MPANHGAVDDLSQNVFSARGQVLLTIIPLFAYQDRMWTPVIGFPLINRPPREKLFTFRELTLLFA